jgi:hypothetical protein
MQETKLGWELAKIPLGWMIFHHSKQIAHTTVGQDGAEAIARQIINASYPKAELDKAVKIRTVQLYVDQKSEKARISVRALCSQ